ncbi:hypothetical protein DASC09_025300 [Saccharomycopsis crataegensis]|uniref:NIF system FeS cluster assembly NifU C-terminal domain-containing protein n=1 Tax=Saccharomycopsis crataegensis TaxID=43959 RepID=A0AAV5QL04_9ASCO|nr:hypothetical protein DASC09_025300 [Saccharomycopsis crataegensis]
MFSRSILTRSTRHLISSTTIHRLTLSSFAKFTPALLTNHGLPRYYSLDAATVGHGSESQQQNDFSMTMNDKYGGSINQELMGLTIYSDARLPQTTEEYELYDDIYKLIQERILPNIQEDGGNMEFRGYDFDNGTVFVKLSGACTSCSMSETTLKHGIEGMLTYFVPEVTGVKQVYDPEEQIAISEFEKFEKNLKAK